MTEQQKKDIARGLLAEIKTQLREAQQLLDDDTKDDSGNATLSKLLEIKTLISEKATTTSIPLEWIGAYFGNAGLSSIHTVCAAAFVKSQYDILGSSHARVIKRAAFLNRAKGKHAEVEMLEWLCENDNLCYQATELHIVISRAPCKSCLEHIVSFLKAQSLKCHIGFYHWYAGSSVGDMVGSMDDVAVNYHVLSHGVNMRCGRFAGTVFEPKHAAKLTSEQPRRQERLYKQAWLKAKQEAYAAMNNKISVTDMLKPITRQMREAKFEEREDSKRKAKRKANKTAREMMERVFGTGDPTQDKLLAETIGSSDEDLLCGFVRSKMSL